MLNKDYMMRLIEIMTRALSRISLLVEEKKYLDSLSVVTEAGKMMTGLDFNMLDYLSDTELLNMIKSKDGLYKGKFLVLGELLAKEGELHLLNQDSTKSYNSYIKSISFYIDGIDENDSIVLNDYIPGIENVITALTGYELPVHIKQKLIRYYDISGQYSNADNIIFEIIKDGGKDVQKQASEFYNTLLNKSDEELNKGNFSKEEAEESLLELKNFAH
ncbi:MAG TPA: DUF6483 family protein [Ignavibacteria bacterium]